MWDDLISLIPRIYLTTSVSAVSIDNVLSCIKAGTFYGQDLQDITGKLRALQDTKQLGEQKKWNLPVALFNGSFSYKDSGSLIQYSNFTALDYDGFSSEERLCGVGRRLMATPCVYAIYRTPSGNGLKAIVMHDNGNPQYHGEMYARLLEKFYTPEIDASGSDLARGNYLCYDPYLWMNPNPEPYHFEHDSRYSAPSSIGQSRKAQCKLDIGELRDMLSWRPVNGKKSDESIMAILGSCWSKKPEMWALGNRANSVFKAASQFCMAGVSIDNALDWLLDAYLKTGLEEEEILYQALRGYQNNAGIYGMSRSKFDGYGRRR